MRYLIIIDVCYEDGWKLSSGSATMDDIQECYALSKDKSKDQCRAKFWSRKLDINIKPGRALIWTYEVIP